MSTRAEQEERGRRELAFCVLRNSRWNGVSWLAYLLLRYFQDQDEMRLPSQLSIAEGTLVYRGWETPPRNSKLTFVAPDVPTAEWLSTLEDVNFTDLAIMLHTNGYLYAAIGALCAWHQENNFP